MESKKDPKLDLGRKRGMFLNVGLVVSLSLAITAFEWKSVYEGPMVNFSAEFDFEPLMDVPLTDIPPPPRPKPTPQIKLIESVDDVIEPDDIVIDTDFVDDAVIDDIVFDAPVPDEKVDEPFVIVEQMPTPIGGMSTFFNFFSKNMKYPNQARRMGIEGRVFIQFVVDKDGTLTDIKVVKGIGGGCDEEALRVMSKVAKWNPGKQRGKPVRVRTILPILFKLGQ